MKIIVENYNLVANLKDFQGIPLGDSASPKNLIFHIFSDNSRDVNVLDIGFGSGNLGQLIKKNSVSAHWNIDGIDGWGPNCFNKDLINSKTYRNIWYGLAQELSASQISTYQVICLLDVIEHLDINTAAWLLRSLLTFMSDDAFLFISTPLWFYPQDNNQTGDLEEHLIGVPITSMLGLMPIKYAFADPLIGGFILGKRSLEFINFFIPTVDKSFSYSKGLELLRAVNLTYSTNVVFNVS